MFGKVGPPVDEESADLPVSRVGENRRDEEERKLVTVANTFRSLKVANTSRILEIARPKQALSRRGLDLVVGQDTAQAGTF